MSKTARAGQKNLTTIISKNKASTHAPRMGKNGSINVQYNLSLRRRNPFWKRAIGDPSLPCMLRDKNKLEIKIDKCQVFVLVRIVEV
jgi:hypothetical protein